MEFNTDNLQVGDKVIVVYRDNFSGCRKYIGTVTKKTPSGLVDVLCCGYTVRYRRDGSENCKRERYVMRDRYLAEYSKEAAEEIIRGNKKIKMVNYLKEYKYADLSYEDLEKVYNMLETLKEKSS